MKNRKFSNIEFQVNSTIKSSCSFQELQKLNSEMVDFLKGRVLTELIITGEINQDLTRSFYQEILAKI
ncbi:hypothetical protein CY0110_31060 [Crocosphaera chwakensis CCY0110]|uniref:Uncharacterized protein n=1 Tax=Crocosphaera chwakensis CCY0110 TaxID=391612 RepID=A3IYT9_9CHRO|nr:hypothetical protein CY0110_31060 [Crocosphaera chwakensis CCY0110]